MSQHPVEKYFEQKQYLGIYKLRNASNRSPILIQVDTIKKIRTKNGQNMAFLTLNDGVTTIDGVMFPDTFKKYEFDLVEDQMFIVNGKFDTRNNKQQLIVNEVLDVVNYEQTVIAQATQIVIRGQYDIDELKAQLKLHESNNMLPVNYYNEAQSSMNNLGYIDKQSIETFIDSFSPNDVRII